MGTRHRLVIAAAAWAGGLAALWALLNPGDTASWLVGAPVVALAAGAALVLRGPAVVRLNWAALPGFFVFFVRASVRGGWDVARLALRPTMPVQPELLTYEMRWPGGPAAVLLTNVVSLLPGTVSAGQEGTRLTIHVLAGSRTALDDLRVLEERIAALLRRSDTEETHGHA